MSTANDKARWRKHTANKYRARRAYMLDKLGGCCAKCGTTENLQIDHIDPSTKSFDLGTGWYKPMELIDAELLKCQLLCESDHLEKSRGEGSLAAGNPYGARCPNAKLTDDVVREIRGSTERTAVLAERYEVSRATVNLVRQKKTWKHVEGL